MTTRWLTPDEREIAHSRPQKNINSFKNNHSKKYQAIEALNDPKTWLPFLYTAFTSLPNGGVTNVSSSLFLLGGSTSLLSSVHISAHQRSRSRPISYPPSRHSSRWLSGCVHSHRSIAGNYIACFLCIAMLGWCLVGYLPASHTHGRLGGVFISAAYASGFPLSLSIIASDVAGYTKKTVVSAVVGELVEINGGRGVVELPSAGVDETDLEQEKFRYIL
jgi:MFS transporter, ACS family, allantoate permease